MAGDLIERILYCFESIWHVNFDPIRKNGGSCQLPYKYVENRSFILALFRHAQMLGR